MQRRLGRFGVLAHAIGIHSVHPPLGVPQTISLLARASAVLTDTCIVGIAATEERCRALVARNLMLATALAPAIGYDNAAAIAKEAFAQNKTAREVAREKGVLPEDQLETLLDPLPMTEPGVRK